MKNIITKFTLLAGVALFLGVTSSAQAQCFSGGYGYGAPITYSYTYVPQYYAPQVYAPQCSAPQYYVPQTSCGQQAPVYYNHQYSQPVQQVCPPAYTHYYQPRVIRQATVYYRQPSTRSCAPVRYLRY